MKIRKPLGLAVGAIALLIPLTAAQNIVRKPLLKADVGAKTIGTVDVREIRFSPNQKTGLHEHPCPVVGYVVSGTILFHVEGHEPQVLHAGDAFYEPANTRILQFDAADQPATFITNYLLAPGETQLIRKLD
ncbi:MAG TPA: cupin domain-containing protein [Bryobacteraceae bacterium]|jgi:mannose-6-phosphate isomerase-like protein (cupin superfamily)|nr:cupin domain-containing protein [Bryobacteraceae bacterium]